MTAVTAEMPPRTRASGLEWQDNARCAGTDPELFFPVSGSSGRQARVFCRACEVAGRALTRSEWELYLPGRAYAPACTRRSARG